MLLAVPVAESAEATWHAEGHQAGCNISIMLVSNPFPSADGKPQLLNPRVQVVQMIIL